MILPLPPTPKMRGRPRGWPLRESTNAIFYVMRSNYPWRHVPADLPPWSTVYRWFAAWRIACVFEKINYVPVIADRERVGREVSYFASIIDSQGVKATEAGAPARRSLSLGRLSAGAAGPRMKIYGRKCQALIDMDGRAPPR